MTFLGVASNGFFTSFTEVLTIPILISSIEEEEGERLSPKKKEKIADKAATLYMVAIGLGSLLGPVIGGGLTDVAGFQLTADIIGSISFFFTVVYFFVVFIPAR